MVYYSDIFVTHEMQTEKLLNPLSVYVILKKYNTHV